MPRVSIGVPVYNGAALLAEALDCLARQTMRDFEVILSDNGSTDATPEICADFARRDSRFRHIRHETTSGALDNFLFARDQARAPYFLWRAYDDLSDETYLEVLADLLDAHPGAVLAAPCVRRIASAGISARAFPYPEQPSDTRLQRLHKHMFRNSACWFYGMWRREACEEIFEDVLARFPDPWGNDHLAIFACALRDAIVGTNDTAFHQRIIHATRDYMPRPKPTYAEMADRMVRFRRACGDLLDASDLSEADREVVRRWLPRYAHRRCYRRDRLWKAWLRQALGR